MPHPSTALRVRDLVVGAPIVAALLALAGCGPSHYHVDGGPEPDGALLVGALTLESEPALTLVFGEQAELAVRYAEGGAPVRDVPVRFALEGLAHDSTLASLARTTDTAGRARTQVIAGSTATVFRVRVSAERAAPAYVDVSVGNMGFGGLRVGTAYAGRRMGTRRVVRVYPGLGCEDELPPVAGLVTTLDDPMATEARFRALPAGLLYAVVGQLEGPTGVVLAHACVDQVEVPRDAETSIALEFGDVPLLLAGRYDTSLELDLTASSAALRDQVVALGTAEVEAAGSDAALYLDALDAVLRESGAVAVADALTLEREEGALELALGERLASESPTAALRVLASALDARLGSIALVGPLSITSMDGTSRASWSVSQLAFGVGGDPDSPPLLLDAASAGLSPGGVMALRWGPEGDVIALERVDLMLPLGTWVEAVLTAEARVAGHLSPAALLHADAGCPALAAFIAESPSLEAACGLECAESACHDALEVMLDAVRAGFGALDGKRDRVELSGSGSADDDDGNLEVDRWASERLEGRFASAVDPVGDAISARLLGVRARLTD